MASSVTFNNAGEAFDTVAEALSDLKNYWEECVQQNTAINTSTINTLLSNVRTAIAEVGLSPQQVEDVSRIVMSDQIKDPVKKGLLEALLPQSVVPSRVAVSLLMWACSLKSSVKLKGLVLRWILLVIDMLDSRQELSAVYFMIFHMLRNESIGYNACRLLNIITRKCDVTPWRIEVLKNMMAGTEGNGAHIVCLLATFKSFRPDLVAFSTSTSVKPFNRNTDRNWAQQIERVQKLYREIPQHILSTFPSGMTAAKKRKLDRLLPPVRSSVLSTLEMSSDGSDKVLSALGLRKVALAEDLRTVESVINNAECAELPSQIGTALGSASVRFLLRLAPQATSSIRLNNWLTAVFEEEFFGAAKPDKGRQGALLQSVAYFCDAMMETTKPCAAFLSKYLPQWNGVDHVSDVLKMVSWLHVPYFEVLHEFYLEPLRNLLMVSSAQFQSSVLGCYNSFLTHYALVISKALLSSDGTSEENSLDVLSQFIEYVGNLGTVLLLMSGDFGVEFGVFTFFLTASRLPKDYSEPCVVLPSKAIIYHGLISSNVAILNMACEMMLNYRMAYLQLQSLDVSRLSEARQTCRSMSMRQVATYNIYLLDYCNSLWRSGAFHTVDCKQNSLFYRLAVQAMELCSKTGVAPEHLTKTLSIYLHPALITYALRFLRMTQPEGTPVHPVALQGARDQYLAYLSQEGLTGIANLIQSSILRRSHNVTTNTTTSNTSST